MKEQALFEIPCLKDKMFPISISYCSSENKMNSYHNHWHDNIEFLYVMDGEGIIECNCVPNRVLTGDLVIVNSGELHCIQSLSDLFSYYAIIIDPALLQSCYTDACDLKYIAPITQSLILFNNVINNDTDILDCINRVIEEYCKKKIGYELSIKSDIYKTIVLLMRNHTRNIIETNTYETKKRELQRLHPVFEYIQANYAQKITGLYLSKLINISHYHFCRIFKEMTNKTVTEYLNVIRINTAIDLLFNTDMNITEISLVTGYNDINYFIRQFKKYMDMPPAAFRAKHSKNKEIRSTEYLSPYKLSSTFTT